MRSPRFWPLLGDSICFIVLSYLLESALLGLRAHILYVLLLTVNACLIGWYWDRLRKVFSVWASAGLFLLAWAVMIGCFFCFGRIEVGPELLPIL